MRVLALFSAYGGARAAMLDDGIVVSQGVLREEHGLAAALPDMLRIVLERAGAPPALVAIAVGPGSFTGLRAGIATGLGLASGLGIPAVAVTVGEAMGHATAAARDGRSLWTATVARRGRVFIEVDGLAAGHANEAVPLASGRVAVCGNAANAVAATLAARGSDVMLLAARAPGPADLVTVALERHAGHLPPRATVPLYVDAPEARPPADAGAA